MARGSVVLFLTTLIGWTVRAKYSASGSVPIFNWRKLVGSTGRSRGCYCSLVTKSRTVVCGLHISLLVLYDFPRFFSHAPFYFNQKRSCISSFGANKPYLFVGRSGTFTTKKVGLWVPNVETRRLTRRLNFLRRMFARPTKSKTLKGDTKSLFHWSVRSNHLKTHRLPRNKFSFRHEHRHTWRVFSSLYDSWPIIN